MIKKVIKIGGSSIQTPESLLKLESLFNAGSGQVFVFSAFGSTTRNLHKSALSALNGNLGESRRLIDRIFGFHSEITAKFADEKLIDKLNSDREALFLLMKGIEITRDLSSRTLDLILSAGERIAGAIISHLIEKNEMNITFADARSIFVTDNNYGNALPDFESSKRNLLNFAANSGASNIAVAGYIAQASNGEATTMGYESSNLTAALAAEIFEAESLIIKTNVSGVRSADPAIIYGTANIPNLSFEQALFAARAGLKLIYPKMIQILQKKNIPVIFENFSLPDSDKTLISNNNSQKSPIVISNHALVVNADIQNNGIKQDKRDNLLTGYSSGGFSHFTVPESEPTNLLTLGSGLINVVFLDDKNLSKALKIASDYDYQQITSSPEKEFISITLPLDKTNELAKKLHEELIER